MGSPTTTTSAPTTRRCVSVWVFVCVRMFVCVTHLDAAHQWEHPMDDYHRGLYKKLKAEKLKGKTQQQLAVTKQEADHKFAAEAARAAAEGVTGPHHRKSSIVVGNGVLAGAKDRKVPKAAAAAAAAAGYSAGNAATVAEGEDKSASAWQKEGARAGSSEKGRQVVSVALGAAAVPSPEVGTTDSTPACSPNETQRSPPSQVDDTRHEELLAAKARKQDKKARLRSKLAAIKGVDVAAAGGGSELGSLSPEEKERLKEREQAKLRSMLELVKEHKRIGGSLNARHQPAGGQLDPLALDPAPLSRHMSLMGMCRLCLLLCVLCATVCLRVSSPRGCRGVRAPAMR
jgi:hypothetical protein